MATNTKKQAAVSEKTAPAIDGRLGAPGGRVERLYDVLQDRMTQKQGAWGGNLTVLDGAVAPELPLVLRHARAFEKVLREMPIAIDEDSLIVGIGIQDGLIVRTRLPEYATAEEHGRAREEGSSIVARLSHKTPYYDDILEKGIAGIVAEVDEKIVEIVHRPPSDERDAKLALFRSMRIECEAVIALAGRYAKLARDQSKQAGSPARRDELLRIAEVCRRVPEFPARTFHEAVQSFWFVHYALFCTGTSLSCGRLDQFLYPQLKKELRAGTITLGQAQELIDCLWLRFNDRGQICRENFFVGDSGNGTDSGGGNGSFSDYVDPLKAPKASVVVDGGPKEWTAGHRKRFSFATDAADAINHFGQNILLGGIRPDGSDGTNELTYLCLNALERFALTSPVVTVRLHRDSPHELTVRTAEVLKGGGGMPYINNDDAIVKGYNDLGVPIEDARDYANSNCWETMIQGKSDQELIRGMNFLLFLELALNRGKSSAHGQMGPDTGDPRGFETFDQLMDAWKVHLDFQLKQGIDHIGEGIESGTLEHSSHGKYAYNPLLSALTLDCLATERDVIRGGARYTIWHVMGEGVANAIDSMAAIKRMAFDEKAVSKDDVLAALAANWEGYENLRLRLIARGPKFANGDDFADGIGREMMDYFVERTRFHAARYPRVLFPCAVGTFSWYAMIGKEVGATPEGRRNREPIAANFSPVPGADMSGPTAAINSYLKMPVTALAAGAPMDLRLSSASLSGDAGTRRLAGLIGAFVDMGGNMLTLTVTDVEELKQAMKEPEKYRHLRVRMGGWSAYFVMLSEEQQLLHIRRIEHGVA